MGGKEKADEAKTAAAKAEKAVDDSAEKAKRAAEKADDASDEVKKD